MPLSLDPFRLLLMGLAGWMNQQQLDVIDYLQEENRVLRRQLGNRRLRLSDGQRRCLAAKAKKLGRSVLREVATIVTPETHLAWHRKLIANKYDGSSYRGVGRRRTGVEIEELVVRMAEENRSWGYRRIQGLWSTWATRWREAPSPTYSSRTVWNRSPERNRKTTWQEFLRQHWEVLVAADFFTVEVWTRKGLTRFMVLFLIDLSTRRVEIGGIAAKTNGFRMDQIARNLRDDVDGFFKGKQYLISIGIRCSQSSFAKHLL